MWFDLGQKANALAIKNSALVERLQALVILRGIFYSRAIALGILVSKDISKKVDCYIALLAESNGSL